MPIDIDIAHVARLARLALDEAEQEHYRRQLGAILEHAARVQSIEAAEAGVGHPLGLTNAFRTDQTTDSLDRNEVLEMAPEARDGYFVAPPALDQDS